MATSPTPCSHIDFILLSRDHGEGFSRCNSVAVTIVDHRGATFTATRPSQIPCPCSALSPHVYHAVIETLATNLCHRLSDELRPCCIAALVPRLVEAITAVNGSRRCSDVFSVSLHIYPGTSADDQETDVVVDEVLRESLEAAEPRRTPASVAAIAELVAEDADCGGCDPCVICMEEMERGESAVKMRCSHVFHRECIVEWLNRSHVCPLCRYEMPVADDARASQH